jgi:hypothetical protein
VGVIDLGSRGHHFSRVIRSNSTRAASSAARVGEIPAFPVLQCNLKLLFGGEVRVDCIVFSCAQRYYHRPVIVCD